MKLRIGTRGSPLALVQARLTRDALVNAHRLDPVDVDIVKIVTTGDKIKDRPLVDIGGKGLFTKEIEEDLLDGTIDLAVHSYKDMPTQLPIGLEIAAVLPREDPRDAFISAKYTSFSDLPIGAILGSSSVRRTAQALAMRPDLKSIDFRGNVETRLQKIVDGVADGTFLACAGLNRLDLNHRITNVMPIEMMLPAVAQGIICIEINRNNLSVHKLLQAINHAPTWIAALCERSFLARLEGSCRTPISGHAILEGDQIIFRGEAFSIDGKHCFETSCQGAFADAERLGRDAADEIKAIGANFINSP